MPPAPPSGGSAGGGTGQALENLILSESVPKYSSIFENHGFLQQVQLTKETVLEYFAMSPFARDTKLTDLQSRNEVTVVDGAIDGGFLIKKACELSPVGVEYYYCIGGVIYMAPPQTSVIASRVVRYRWPVHNDGCTRRSHTDWCSRREQRTAAYGRLVACA